MKTFFLRIPKFGHSSPLMTLAWASSVAMVTGCVTPRPSPKPVDKPVIIEKAQDKPEAGEGIAHEKDKSPETKPATGRELWSFVRQQSKPGAPWGDEQRNLVERMRNEPSAGSVAEAALTIGLIRSALSPLHQPATTFEESDLNIESTEEGSEIDDQDQGGFAAPEAFAGSGPSLETLSKERGINIPDALTENPLLGSATIAKSALEALRVGPNSQEFMNDVLVAVRARARNWQEVSLYLGDQLPVADQDGDLEAPLSSLDPHVAPNPADLRSGDTLLVDAQKLADQGNYKAALDRIDMIPENSPLYSLAEEKKREFSNRAVQDLRRKAAQAFRSAVPGADLETRAQYLREAKAFLEQAIQSYPSAPQLPTVRENLRVISQDLEKLERSRG